MTTFEMVKYHNQAYPSEIPLRIAKCAANFDTTAVTADLKLSLHTEYSYAKRKFDSAVVQQFPTIVQAHKDGVPQLWKSEQWAREFAEFIFALAGDECPTVIEIHPPFTDYCDFGMFLNLYKVFETLILEKYPDVAILIENRCGSVYRGGKFLVSKHKDIDRLCDLIAQNHLRLKIAYDVPQIYTAHNVKKADKYIELLQQATEYRPHIGGVHLWGKRKSATGRKVAHCGDLTSYFAEAPHIKESFLQQFQSTFDDGVTRKMVLEVNSGNDDLMSIVADLKAYGISFI